MSSHSDLDKLASLIKDARIALVTTVEPDGTLHTRPLSTLKYEAGGDLWFFVSYDSAKVEELREDVRVSVAYANTDDDSYVAISGTGQVMRDQAKAKELWTAFARPWFPQGLDDPELALLRIRVERAEYWTSPGKAAYLFAIAKSVITGKQTQMGENRKLNT
jgi:general stress protein 26